MNKTFPLLLCILPLLSSCSSNASKAILEMELRKDYDTSDPFVHANLFSVSEDMDTLALDISFQPEGESGILEIADNETGEVFWSDSWNENVDKTNFAVSLEDVKKAKEYVIRFTGTKINYAKITLSSKSGLVKERAKPLKSK